MRILLKRSDTTGSVPAANQLMYGELALNTADGKLYTKTTDGSVVQLGTVTQSPVLPVGTIVPAVNNAFQITDYLPCTGGTYAKSGYPALGSLLGDSYQLSGTHTYFQANTQVMTYVSGIFTVYPNTSLARYASESNLGTWNVANIGVIKTWTGVEYIRNSGVLCGVTSTDSTVIRSSTSGTSWSIPTTTGMISVNHTSACSGNNGACIITNGITSLTTTDGVTYNLGTMPSNRNWQGVAWNGSVFCAVAYGANVAATSSDGLNWTQQTIPATGNWADISWNGSVFCTISNGSNVAATSPDGATWTLRSMSATGNWTGIGYHSGVAKFLAVSTNHTGCLSSDGISWTTTLLPSSISYKRVVSNDAIYMVNSTTNGNAMVVTSPDGITWTQRDYTANPVRGSALAFRPLSPSNGLWACTTSSNGAVWSTNSGVSWSVSSIGVNIVKSYLVWTGSAFLYGCNSASLNTSTTGSGAFLTTTTGFNPVYAGAATDGSGLIAIGVNSRLVSRTRDTGINWDNFALPQNASWSGIAYGSGMYCAIATGTVAAYSYNGTGWFQTTLPTGQLWSSIAYSTDKFVAVANGSSVGAASYDGINWFRTYLPASYSWRTIKSASDGTTVIVPQNSTYLAISSDGLSYRLYNILTSTISPTTCAFGSGNGRIVVAGAGSEANTIIRDTGRFTVPLISELTGNLSGITQKYYIKT